MNSLTLSSPNISKKEIQQLAAQLVESLPEDTSPLETYAKLQKIKILAESAMSALKAQALDSIGDDGAVVLGGKMSWMGGGKAFSGEKSYGHYQKWVDAVKKVKEIEGEMKLVEKQGTVIVDEETGEVVPAALAQTRKASLKYLF